MHRQIVLKLVRMTFIAAFLAALIPLFPVQAADLYCWCKTSGGTCEYHTVKDGLKDANGNAVNPVPFSDNQGDCSSYCKDRGLTFYQFDDSGFTDHTKDPGCSAANQNEGACSFSLPSAQDKTQSIPISTSCVTDQDCQQACVSSCQDKQYSCAQDTCTTLAPKCVKASATAGSSGGTDTSAKLYNPLGDVTIQGLVARLIRAVIGIVGSLALAAFIYGGIVWMTSGGNEKRVAQGKAILINATIGLLLIFFSYTIVNAFLNIFSGAVSSVSSTTNSTQTK